jgi:hypothetical protein
MVAISMMCPLPTVRALALAVRRAYHAQSLGKPGRTTGKSPLAALPDLPPHPSVVGRNGNWHLAARTE